MKKASPLGNVLLGLILLVCFLTYTEVRKWNRPGAVEEAGEVAPEAPRYLGDWIGQLSGDYAEGLKDLKIERPTEMRLRIHAEWIEVRYSIGSMIRSYTTTKFVDGKTVLLAGLNSANEQTCMLVYDHKMDTLQWTLPLSTNVVASFRRPSSVP